MVENIKRTRQKQQNLIYQDIQSEIGYHQKELKNYLTVSVNLSSHNKVIGTI